MIDRLCNSVRNQEVDRERYLDNSVFEIASIGPLGSIYSFGEIPFECLLVTVVGRGWCIWIELTRLTGGGIAWIVFWCSRWSFI